MASSVHGVAGWTKVAIGRRVLRNTHAKAKGVHAGILRLCTLSILTWHLKLWCKELLRLCVLATMIASWTSLPSVLCRMLHLED